MFYFKKLELKRKKTPNQIWHLKARQLLQVSCSSALLVHRAPRLPACTCKALTTRIGCSSPRAWMQCWNKQLMLSLIFISSSPSRDSSLPSRYSKFTCQRDNEGLSGLPGQHSEHIRQSYLAESSNMPPAPTFMRKSSSQNRGLHLLGSSVWNKKISMFNFIANSKNIKKYCQLYLSYLTLKMLSLS
jgi:hypothetical protein